MRVSGRRRHWRWLAIGGAALVVLAVAGPYVYIHLVEGDAPAPLAAAASPSTTQPTGSTASTASGGEVGGAWKLTSGSQAGYRVNEVLFGQNSEAVGRTSFPTARFTLASPIDLPSIPADGASLTVKASGRLALHGTTRTVTVDLTTQRSGDTIRASGQIPVTFADWGIPNPSFGPVTTDDHGQIEFLLVFAHV